jgi:hypothetical protein
VSVQRRAHCANFPTPAEQGTSFKLVLEKLTVAQLVRKSHGFVWNRILVFTPSRHWASSGEVCPHFIRISTISLDTLRTPCAWFYTSLNVSRTLGMTETYVVVTLRTLLVSCRPSYFIQSEWSAPYKFNMLQHAKTLCYNNPSLSHL